MKHLILPLILSFFFSLSVHSKEHKESLSPLRWDSFSIQLNSKMTKALQLYLKRSDFHLSQLSDHHNAIQSYLKGRDKSHQSIGVASEGDFNGDGILDTALVVYTEGKDKKNTHVLVLIAKDEPSSSTDIGHADPYTFQNTKTGKIHFIKGYDVYSVEEFQKNNDPTQRTYVSTVTINKKENSAESLPKEVIKKNLINAKTQLPKDILGTFIFGSSISAYVFVPKGKKQKGFHFVPLQSLVNASE